MRTSRFLAVAIAVVLAACSGMPAAEEPPLLEGAGAPFEAEEDPRFVPAPREAPPEAPADGGGATSGGGGGAGDAEEAGQPRRDRAAPFVGLGAWIDVYDDELWADPEGTVARLARRGVGTLFLQTTSYRRRGPIRFPAGTARFLEAAHARGLSVVAWYLPGLDRMRRDLAWSVAATAFTTGGGEGFDGFALDIEATEVADPWGRADRAVRLSLQLRRAVGPDYPLGAITPSPLRGPDYWPVLPIEALAEIYDVILPMAYWDSHASGRAGAFAYIARSIDLLRTEGGDDLPVHVIGGVAEDATPEEVAGFARAVRGRGLVGASIYDVGSMRPTHWDALASLPHARWRG